MTRTLSLLALVLFAAFASPIRAESIEEADFVRDVRPLLKRLCVDCHGDFAPEGDLDLARFEDEKSVAAADPKLWEKFANRVRRGEMPPEEAEQPTAAERERLLEWARDRLADPALAGAPDPGRPVLRRLTRLEYNNTVRDLLGLETDVFLFPERLPIDKRYFDPATGRMPARLDVRIREYGAKTPTLVRFGGLPEDARAEHGFTNRGDAMNFSPLLMEKYLAVAAEIAASPDLAASSPRLAGLLPGATSAWNSTTGKTERIDGEVTEVVAAVGDFAPNENVSETAPGSSASPNAFEERVASAFADDEGGVWDVSKDRNNATLKGGRRLGVKYGRSGEKRLLITPSDDLWMAAFATAAETSGDLLFTNRKRDDKRFSLVLETTTGEGIVELAVNLLSRRGESGRITLTAVFSNGESQPLTDEFAGGAGADNTFFAFAAPEGARITRLDVDGSKFSGTFVLLDDLAFVTDGVAAKTGRAGRPEANVGSDASKQSVQPDTETDPLETFLERAFRGPISEEELTLFRGVRDRARSAGATEEEAARTLLRAVLSSARFLYRVDDTVESAEPGGRVPPVAPLDDFALANRLSYFLWSSMPDDELLALARAGRLRDPTVLEEQTRRMLRDPKSRELSESFCVQWLQMQKLLGARPDPKRNPEFYRGPKGKNTLAMPMLVETLLLFETIHSEDRSILEFVDGPFLYLNEDLADLYDLGDEYDTRLAELDPEEAKQEGRDRDGGWLRIDLPDRRRGGILTMGSTLVLTSLPLRTSPVYRGSWMLEAVFKNPPPPPPAMVDELGADDRSEEGLTLRQRLEQHRENESCAVCHRRIDPLGFALENFDPIGKWRTEYGDDLPIDATGTLPGDRSFDGPVEFKDRLLERRDDFARAFVEHLLSYALGRELTLHDTETVDEIVAAVREDDYRFSRVVVEIVKSYPFRYGRVD